MTDAERVYNEFVESMRFQAFIKGLHKHRIQPGYTGGKYVSGNVLYLTRKEHIKIHRFRYFAFSNYRDLLACKLLGDNLSDEEWLACAKAGGHIVGTKHRLNGTGVCGRSKEKMSIDGKKGRAALSPEVLRRGGLTTGNRLKREGRGIFGISPEQIRLNCQKGGRIAFTNLSYNDRTKGVLGSKWITNGYINIRFFIGNEMPDGFKFGKTNYVSKGVK